MRATLATAVAFLVAAAPASAATITTWAGGKASTPQIVTAGGTCPGTMITITGSGFTSDGGPLGVTIGGAPASQVIIGSDERLYARVAPGTSTGPVVVTTRAGSVTAPLPAIVVPCQTTGIASVKPMINAAVPQIVKGGKKTKLVGGGFVGTRSVTVNGAPATYAIPSDGVMYVIVPKAGAKGGLVTIVVTNNLGTAKVVVEKVD